MIFDPSEEQAISVSVPDTTPTPIGVHTVLSTPVFTYIVLPVDVTTICLPSDEQATPLHGIVDTFVIPVLVVLRIQIPVD